MITTDEISLMRIPMEWIWCKDCIYVDDCIEATRADGCYAGEREEI